MKIPFVDFSESYRMIREEVDRGMHAVFEKGDFILGEAARKFEADFARYCGVEYGVGVNSGTDALYLALSALDVGPGDEVVLPTFTFIATALCVSYTGATPVFADVEPCTYNLDPASLEKAVTDRTKVILPVHIYGQAADMEEIRSFARSRGIKVVEDACQAHGASYHDRRVGSLGDVACFSFYPTKGLGAAGDAGIVVTDDTDVYERLLMLRDYGRKGRYDHKIKGFNSRLDTLQAVVLAAKLPHLDEWNRMRARAAQTYRDLLCEVPEVGLPRVAPDRTHVYQTFAVRIPHRDAVCAALQDHGIGVLIHYPIPLHLQEAYTEMGWRPGSFPVAERLCGEVLSLPMFPHITETQIRTVCDRLKEALVGR